MLFVKEKHSSSWFDHKAVPYLSKKLEVRLTERMKGKKAKFITLTYDRDPYENGLDLYRRQQEERHIRRFIERLQNKLGVSFCGKWMRKMEFQKEGWLHWHMIIEYGPKIDQQLLTKLWGHGHVWINHMNKKRLKYFCKYTAKSMWNETNHVGPFGMFPGWIYAERARSVKVIAVSRGFWGGSGKEGKKNYYIKKPYYTPLGETLGKVGVKCFLGGTKFRDLNGVDLGTIIVLLGLIRKNKQGWYAVGNRKVRGESDYAYLSEKFAKREGGRAPEACGSFHLLKGGKPPNTGLSKIENGLFSCFQFLKSMGLIEEKVNSNVAV